MCERWTSAVVAVIERVISLLLWKSEAERPQTLRRFAKKMQSFLFFPATNDV
jgi:hypothetical protein